MIKRIKKLGKQTKTLRGFNKVDFIDSYDIPCSLQESSNSIPSVWLGPTDAKPEILATDAMKLGLRVERAFGWMPYPIPEKVLLHTRMHLSRRQVVSLVNHLNCWLKTGEFV